MFFHEKLDIQDDWLIEIHKDKQTGTNVQMQISTYAAHAPEDIFNKYAAENDDYGFTKLWFGPINQKNTGRSFIVLN